MVSRRRSKLQQLHSERGRLLWTIGAVNSNIALMNSCPILAKYLSPAAKASALKLLNAGVEELRLAFSESTRLINQEVTRLIEAGERCPECGTKNIELSKVNDNRYIATCKSKTCNATWGVRK